jgi:hypothetical protein
MRSMKKLALVLIALAAGCTEKVHVNIACDPKNTPTGPTAECIVHQDKGKAEVEVCWDFSVDCPGGIVVKAERQ